MKSENAIKPEAEHESPDNSHSGSESQEPVKGRLLLPLADCQRTPFQSNTTARQHGGE